MSITAVTFCDVWLTGSSSPFCQLAVDADRAGVDLHEQAQALPCASGTVQFGAALGGLDEREPLTWLPQPMIKWLCGWSTKDIDAESNRRRYLCSADIYAECG